MKKLVEVNMFWIMLGIFLLSIIQISGNYFGTWNLNKTIGWGWEITDFHWLNKISFTLSTLVFTIGYGILFKSKRRTVFMISIVQIILTFSSFVTQSNYFEISIIALILSWIIFLVTMFNSKKIERIKPV